MPKAKATTKRKVAKKEIFVPVEAEAKKYNEFGVCVSCNGGKEECVHNNLVEHQGHTYCNTCGLVVK
jgi:hypothetical protein